MTDATLEAPLEPARRFQFHWVPAVLFRPRQAFAKILSHGAAVWLTPLLILTLTALFQTIVAGTIKQAAAQSGQITLPPDYQWYTPEQQAQFQQAMAATQGPVFIYIFPAITAVLRVWFGWLIVGGLIHLALTLLGARGDTSSALNLVAWASLPFAIRDLVRGIAMLATDRLVSSPGLSGFVPLGEGSWNLFLVSLLALVDIYLIWHIVLLIIGVRAGGGLPAAKGALGISLVIVLVLSVQALISFGLSRLGGLTVIRPFF